MKIKDLKPGTRVNTIRETKHRMTFKWHTINTIDQETKQCTFKGLKGVFNLFISKYGSQCIVAQRGNANLEIFEIR